MLQVKISAVLVTVVVAVTAFACFALGNRLGAGIVADEAAELAVTTRATSSVHQLADAALRLQVAEVANDDVVVRELDRLQKTVLERGDIGPLKDQLNRATLFTALLERNRELGKRLGTDYGKLDTTDAAAAHAASTARPVQDWWGTAPDLVLAFVATPLKGERVAHALVAHAEEGQELAAPLDYAQAQPLLRDAERGVVSGVMSWSSREYMAVAAPVRDSAGALVGTVVLGYQLDALLAERIGGFTGGDQDVIFFSDLRLYGPTRADYRDELADASFQHVDEDGGLADDATAFEALEGDETYVAEVGDRRLAVRRHLWQAPTDDHAGVGFLVTSDLDAPLAAVSELQLQLILVAAALLLLALIAVVLFVRRFTAPLEQLTVGLQEVVAGQSDHTFQPQPAHKLQAALAEQLNQLSQRLQAAPEAGGVASTSSGQDWDRMMVDLEPERPSVFGLAAVPRLSDNGDTATLRALYDEYMARRRELGQHVDMDFDRFCRRIRRNEGRLREKHNATAVRFSVAVADGKVVLKPTLHFD